MSRSSTEYPRPGIWLFIGRRASGKTTKAAWFARELLRHGRDIVVAHVPHSEGYGGTAWENVAQFRAAIEAQIQEVPKVNIFRRDQPGDVAQLAVDLALRGLRVVLLVDELDRVCTPYSYADDNRRGEAPGATRLIVNEGRHVGGGIDLIGTARRPTSLHSEVQELAECIWLFSSKGRNTLRWVEDTCGDEIDDSLSVMRGLEGHDYALWRPGHRDCGTVFRCRCDGCSETRREKRHPQTEMFSDDDEESS